MITISVAIFSHYSINRAGLAALICNLPGLCLVDLDFNSPPQVLVWDAEMDDLDQPPTLPPGTAWLLLISGQAPTSLPPGVAGLFSKDEAPEALGVAIRQVARGEQYLSPSLALAILQQKQAEPVPPTVDLGNLTEREREILGLLGKGLSNKAIAARLYLSVRTVEGHLAKVYTLFGVHSRMEAMRVAIQSGLTSLDR